MNKVRLMVFWTLVLILGMSTLKAILEAYDTGWGFFVIFMWFLIITWACRGVEEE